MASLLTPKTLRRGFELFVVVSLVSYVGVFLYGNDAASFLPTLARIQWGWVLVGFCLASMDWIGAAFGSGS